SNWNLVAGLGYHHLGMFPSRQPAQEAGVSAGLVFDCVPAMIVPLPDRDPARQFRGISTVIAVIVADDHVIELLQAGFLDGPHDVLGLNMPRIARAYIVEQ